MATEQISKKAPGEMVGALLPPRSQPVFTCPSRPQEIQDFCPFVLSSQDLLLCLVSLALSWYPARHPFQGSMASFKLCYYGNGHDVTIPLAWIIKSKGEAEGNRAGWIQLLCSPRLEEELKGSNRSFCNWFLSERSPCLQMPSKKHEKLQLEKTY